MRADYFKKAIGQTFFICEDGKSIYDAIEQSILLKESKSITVKSVGRNKDNELIAEFYFTWSFKLKNS